ncbi:MAG TPA: T9SS type A sorting domain-containing protein [Chitinophagaceae bacterium]|nr:T9SS type A sorting domain-containing protein [Chitinophagaceae bacterium]
MRFFYVTFLILLSSLQLKSQPLAGAFPDSAILRFFPNPAISQITFNFEKIYDKNYSLQVFNFLGKKVYESQTPAPRTIVDLTTFYRGVYIFQVRDRVGKIIESGKFQVIK